MRAQIAIEYDYDLDLAREQLGIALELEPWNRRREPREATRRSKIRLALVGSSSTRHWYGVASRARRCGGEEDARREGEECARAQRTDAPPLRRVTRAEAGTAAEAPR